MRVLVDENLPRVVRDLLEAVGVPAWRVRDQMQGAPDEVWIARASELRAVGFTLDGRIRSNADERTAVFAHGVTVFVFDDRGNILDTLRRVLNRLRDIQALADRPSATGRFFLVTDTAVKPLR